MYSSHARIQYTHICIYLNKYRYPCLSRSFMFTLVTHAILPFLWVLFVLVLLRAWIPRPHRTKAAM